MANRSAASSPVARLAGDLITARWRGIDGLNVHNSHQKPRDVPVLAQLAHEFCEARAVILGDRVAEIRLCLQEALRAYAADGHTAEAEVFQRLYLEPSESVTPHDVLQAVRAQLELRDPKFNYTKWRSIAYRRLAAYLITFVAASTAPELRPADVVTFTSSVETPPRPGSGCMRLVLAGLASLVLVGMVVMRSLVGATAPQQPATAATPVQATIITGVVECAPDPTKAVVGVWVVGSNGGSGWAHYQPLPGHPNIALFDRTLPTGSRYVVHVGCGGTPANWELTLGSVTPVTDSGYHFTCYASTSDQHPYLGQCRP